MKNIFKIFAGISHELEETCKIVDCIQKEKARQKAEVPSLMDRVFLVIKKLGVKKCLNQLHSS